ncbi:MAG: primosomal protein N' (replication factor Y) - superfamily II helicase, partial [Rhodobacteraceae bacterium]|nr:primosomal protein N' (replication factor Y) - superfamily II helicase [Paracoccaceae bacterium]
RFPCPACGADLRFDPASGDLACDHCGRHEALGQTHPGERIREIDIRAGLDSGLPDSDIELARWSRCPNCGAQVEFDPAVHALDCPFCATPVVADTGETRRIKPRGVVPFALTERQARAAMTAWLGSLWFAPDGLMEYARKGRSMQGIYVPFWTFDADTKSTYTGRRGDAYTDTELVTVRDAQGRSRTERRNVTRIRWTPASGRVARFFDDVLVLASRSLPQGHTDALTPWDLSRLVPYQPEYLAGFRAEGYTVPLEEGLKEARAYMDRMIERDVRFDIGGDRQEIHSIETQVSDVTFKHILLPVWLAAYRFRGRSYRFVVNGQTGKVKGERPWSAVKLFLFGLLIAVLTALALYVADRNGAFDNFGAGNGGFRIEFGN